MGGQEVANALPSLYNGLGEPFKSHFKAKVFETGLKSLKLSSNLVVPLNWPYFDSSIKKAIADALQQTSCMHMSLVNVQGICENDISFILMFCKNLELNACTLLPGPETLSHLCIPLIPTNCSLKVSDRLDIKKVVSFPRGLLVGLLSLILVQVVPRTGQLESFLEISRVARHTLLNLEWHLGYCMSGNRLVTSPYMRKPSI